MVFIKTKTEYDSQLFETIYKRELEVVILESTVLHITKLDVEEQRHQIHPTKTKFYRKWFYKCF